MNIWNDYKGKGILALVLFIFYWSFYFFIGWKMDTHSKLFIEAWVVDTYFSFDQGYYIISFFLEKVDVAAATWFRHPFLYYFIQQFMWMLGDSKSREYCTWYYIHSNVFKRVQCSDDLYIML